MRLTLHLPDEVVPALNARAGAASVSREEFALRAVLAACTGGPGGPLTLHECTRMEEVLRERDELAARVSELEQLARVAAAEVAASQASRERMEQEQDRIEDQRTRARTRAALAADERDRARAGLAAALDRAAAAERRASVAEALAAERLERCAELREVIRVLTAGVPAPRPPGTDDPAAPAG